MSERVFFDRDGFSPELRAVLSSQVMPVKLIPSAKDGRATVVAPLGRRGEFHTVSWSDPVVPPLWSKPSTRKRTPKESVPVLVDPTLRRLEHMLEAHPVRSANRSHAFGKEKPLSQRDPSALTRMPAKKHMSARWSDPLAMLDNDDAAQETRRPEFIMPFARGRVTSLFNDGRRHPAIDLAGALGSPVLATTVRQKVVFAGWRGGYGNAVITRDADGRTHLYGHLQSITSRVGQMLSQGEKLGHLGSTGHSTGPHVHYELRTSTGRHINPVTLLFPGRGVGKGYAWRDVVPPGERPVSIAAAAQR